MDKAGARHFWSLVLKGPDCWEWQGTIAKNGYGRIGSNYAHRFSAALHGLDITGKLVCHTCDNRMCVNPKHLFTGTARDNIFDMVVKSRHAKGERKRQAKLTNAQILQIRSAPGKQRDIAAEFGISQSRVSIIKSGKAWKHIA